MRGWMLAALLAVLPLPSAWAAAGDVTVADQSSAAYRQPLPGLTAAERDLFSQGRTLFDRPWVLAPAGGRLHDPATLVGLGPVYNDISCLGCHVGNGGGGAPAGPDVPMHGMLVRLSLPLPGPHGGPRPLPAYGDQLNDHAVPGVPAEGQARLVYTLRTVVLAGGQRVALRVPHLKVGDLHFGPLGAGALFSPRIAQPVYGGGLLEAIPAPALEAAAARQRAEGGPVRGRVNQVWDIALGRSVPGRFGWKANQPSLAQQAAGAANGDMGLTSPLFPDKNCRAAQTACQGARRGPQPDLTAARLRALATYLRGLAVPARRGAQAPAVLRGERLFSGLGCASCHQPTWKTGDGAALAALSGQTIHPYSDLLLHDMGPGLADGRPDFQASGRDWRTPPLWGIGLARRINADAGFLHDGRARSLLEAVLWHGGEADTARAAFAALSKGDRDDVLAFLSSL